MEGRQLLQYIIDTSTVMLAKRQEATEYLAKLEAAQQSVQADGFVAVPNSNLEVNQILDAKAVVIRRR